MNVNDREIEQQLNIETLVIECQQDQTEPNQKDERRKMLKNNSKLKILRILIGFALLFSVQNSTAQAYTVMSGKWATSSTTYVIDSSFSSQGPGWSSRFNSAANNWTQGGGAFGFSANSSSSNHIQASILRVAAIAVLHLLRSGVTQFINFKLS